jgi:hypothetical protein
VGASAQPEGAFLNARVVGDEAFYAQVRALSRVSNDIAAVYEQMEEISAALSSGPPPNYPARRRGCFISEYSAGGGVMMGWMDQKSVGRRRSAHPGSSSAPVLHADHPASS